MHPDAPDLAEVEHRFDRGRPDRIRLCFRFANGTDWNSTTHLLPEFTRYRHSDIAGALRGREFFHACGAIWRRLRAEQPHQRALHELRIQYQRQIELVDDGAQARELGQWFIARQREIEAQLIGATGIAPAMMGVDLGAVRARTATYTYYDGERFNRRHLLEGDWLAPPPRRPSPESEARGLALLKEWLSPAQRAEYEKLQHFEVRGCDTGARYRIRHGTQMNIEQLDRNGRRVCGWCFLPEGGLVAGDVMLAQKIALETNERAALKVANRIAQMSDGPYRPGGIMWMDEAGNFHVPPIP